MAPMPSIPEYLVVGASPAGLIFALSLLQNDKTAKASDICIIETNAADRSPGGPFWLTPNALRILDKLVTSDGSTIYEKCQGYGYHGTHHTFRDEKGEFLGCWPFGYAERWGYDAIRIDRGIVIKVLEAELVKRNVTVNYSTSLRQILRENVNEVEVEVRQGSKDAGDLVTLQARRLIGADGIHSRTRHFVCGKEIQPAYTGQFMGVAYVPRSCLRYGPDFAHVEQAKEYSLSVNGSHGTILMIPDGPNGERLQIDRTWASPNRTRAEWEAFSSDKPGLLELFTKDKHEWSDLPRSSLDAITEDSIALIWPMYLLPRLERWVSPASRVVIIGDAAHTVIPAVAQGANQAIEDGWTLAQAYAASASAGDEIATESLRAWETRRIERLGRIAKLSVELMNVRLPPEERARMGKDEVFDLTNEEEAKDRVDWLYGA